MLRCCFAGLLLLCLLLFLFLLWLVLRMFVLFIVFVLASGVLVGLLFWPPLFCCHPGFEFRVAMICWRSFVVALRLLCVFAGAGERVSCVWLVWLF